jgi:polyhydroxyalkanoate synthesis regulator phasin
MSHGLQQASRLTVATIAAVSGNVAAAAASSSQPHGADVTAIIGWITAAVLSFCASVVLVSPVIARAIKDFAATVGPALAELQKQREEIRKGPLSRQIEHLQQLVEEGNLRTEDANKKLHDLQSRATTDAMLHSEETERLTHQLQISLDQQHETAAELHQARLEIRQLREDAQRRTTLLSLEQAHQAGQIAEGQQAIKKILSGETPVVKPEG